MVLGCLKLDKRVDIRGVVLNQIGTKRHQTIVTRAVEKYTGIPVLGAIPRMKRDIFPMRHLGVTPHQEYEGSELAMDMLADAAAAHLDIAKIQDVMVAIHPDKKQIVTIDSKDTLKIGLLVDAAFQFYYSENLEALEREGAELIPVNALEEQELPDLDGLYIGGGFPETSAKLLAANESFRKSVKEAAENGLPVYAECGGLIYLGESIELDGEVHPLTGVFPIRFGMSRKPQAHGYSVFMTEKNNPFYTVGQEVKGHEFRYSKILDWKGKPEDLALNMIRGTGFMDGRDGLVRNNVLALYTHIHAMGTPAWAKGFMTCCKSVRAR